MLAAGLRLQAEPVLAQMAQAAQNSPALFHVDCAAIAAEFGLSPERSVFSAIISPDRASLTEALSKNCFCVEYFQQTLNVRNHLAETMLGVGGFYVLLSTAAAVAIEPDRALMEVLAQRLGLSRAQSDRIETALHEALLNALLYGNLELDSSQRQTVDGFNDYCKEVERRLSDPCFASRWVEIRASWSDKRVNINVACNGQAFDETKIDKKCVPGQRHGWGIRIMREITDVMHYSEQGRNLSLSFKIC